MKLWLAIILGAVTVAFAQSTPRVERDIAYSEPRNGRHLLDIYAPPNASKLPVVVWVHGGGWMRGGKHEVNQSPPHSPRGASSSCP